MNVILNQRMMEATRLTREGKLMEATALLRNLQGSPAAPSPPVADHQPKARPPGRIFDVDLDTDATVGDGQTRGQFLTGTHVGEKGSLGFKLYVPVHAPARRLPLIVMLHGCTQSPDDFAAGTRMNELADEEPCLVVYPRQSTAANAQKCWNWFSPGDQTRGRGEPALIAGLTRQIIRDHEVDPARIYAAGLSAGGAAAAIMGSTYPDLYAAIGVHSGLACGAAHDLPSAFAAMRGAGPALRPRAEGRTLPTIVFHADQDSTVHPRNGDAVLTQAGGRDGAYRVTVEEGQVPGGRRFSRRCHRDEGGRIILEQWTVHGGGHAWSGGSDKGSYTDPRGPDASRAMLRFFQANPHDAPC